MTNTLNDEIAYLNSREYAMGLIQYPDGNNATNDIDFVSTSFKNEVLLFGECKQFVNGKKKK